MPLPFAVMAGGGGKEGANMGSGGRRERLRDAAYWRTLQYAAMVEARIGGHNINPLCPPEPPVKPRPPRQPLMPGWLTFVVLWLVVVAVIGALAYGLWYNATGLPFR